MATAQASIALQNQKASPVGCLNRSLLMDTMTFLKLNHGQRHDVHRFVTKTPQGFCPVVSQTEKLFVQENFDKIERRRELENMKELLRQAQKNTDVLPEVTQVILEPVPNENHSYCQVCNENYEDYLEHIT